MAFEAPRVGNEIPRPGRMTLIMRAARSGAPRLLRIGWVRGGRLVEERLSKPRTDVTVGSAATCTFVLDAPGAPKNFCLIEARGDHHVLRLSRGMQGRLVLPSGVVDVTTLAARGEVAPGGVHEIRLDRDFRGKVTIGDSTFLLQLVAAPPETPRAQLPASVLRGTASIDWRTTMVAAASFLSHFFVIGTAYSDWLDPVVDDRIDVAGLVETAHPLPGLEAPVEDADEEVVRQEHPTSTTNERPAPTESTARNRPPTTTPTSAAVLAGSLATITQTLGTLGTGRAATAGVLAHGDVPTSTLDDAARASTGVAFGLEMGRGTSTIEPGVHAGLEAMGSTKTSAGHGTGEVQGTRAPQGRIDPSTPVQIGGRISDAARVIAGLRPGFRRCYNRGLSQSPDSEGRIALSFHVGPGGEVQRVTVSASGSLPPSVVACVRAHAESAQFAAPEGGSGLVQVPVSFVKQ
jgi:hypothetical protein